MLADVFDNFRNMCLKIYKLDRKKLPSTPGLAWKAVLKQIKVKLDLLTDVFMFLIVEKGIRGGICHSIYQYAKASNKYMIFYEKNKETPYIQYWDVNNLYVWAVSQKLPLNNLESIKGTS